MLSTVAINSAYNGTPTNAFGFQESSFKWLHVLCLKDLTSGCKRRKGWMWHWLCRRQNCKECENWMMENPHLCTEGRLIEMRVMGRNWWPPLLTINWDIFPISQKLTWKFLKSTCAFPQVLFSKAAELPSPSTSQGRWSGYLRILTDVDRCVTLMYTWPSDLITIAHVVTLSQLWQITCLIALTALRSNIADNVLGVWALGEGGGNTGIHRTVMRLNGVLVWLQSALCVFHESTCIEPFLLHYGGAPPHKDTDGLLVRKPVWERDEVGKKR